jgi:hypothetical protein
MKPTTVIGGVFRFRRTRLRRRHRRSVCVLALTADPTLRGASASTREGTGIVTVTDGGGRRSAADGATAFGRARLHLDQGRKGLTDELTVIAPVVVDLDYHICVGFIRARGRAAAYATALRP